MSGDRPAEIRPGMRDLRSQLMTGPMAAGAHADAGGRRPPAGRRPASTVDLIRDSAADPDVYLLRRQRTMAVAAEMTVFAGGRVDATDSTVADSWSGPAPEWFAGRLGCAAD